MRVDIRRCTSEAVGTFMLVAVGPGAAMVSASTNAFGHLGVALAFGLVVSFVVAATGHISGAHINPAVTIGLWSVRRFPRRDVLPYIVAQCLALPLRRSHYVGFSVPWEISAAPHLRSRWHAPSP
jgi:glycerol uptake facilitator-like aquaporin